MVRGLLDAIGLFALPFLLYGALLALRRWFPVLGGPRRSGRLELLAIAGLGLVLAALLLYGLLAPRHEGAYVPAHIEGGRLVPGELH